MSCEQRVQRVKQCLRCRYSSSVYQTILKAKYSTMDTPASLRIQYLYKIKVMSTIIDYLSSFGSLIDSKSGKEGTVRDFQYKYLGLYFTATWCSYCVQIVNKLPAMIDRVNKKGEFLKLLTLRLDQDQNNFAYSYLRYKNISYQDATGIASRLGARQIPSIFIFDIYGTLVTRNGLQDIMRYQENTIDYWDRNVEEYYKKSQKK